jgi:hypothetical protein
MEPFEDRLTRALALGPHEPIVAAVVGLKKVGYASTPRFATMIAAGAAGTCFALHLPLQILVLCVFAAAGGGMFLDHHIAHSAWEERADARRRQKTAPTFVAATPTRVLIGGWNDTTSEASDRAAYPPGDVIGERREITAFGLVTVHHALRLRFCDDDPDLELIVPGFVGPIDKLVTALGALAGPRGSVGSPSEPPAS